ncbi:MAG: hypothetical protein GY737_24600 [Desulfobacteraceae bacterium]|nr:hypothetical protein [Desulfobacteraceae bacterium]
MKKYLSYDIRGIQQFIFSIPQLKYIIGGSLMIAGFDRKWENPPDGVEKIFTGGGKGIFRIENDAVKQDFQEDLIRSAHSKGLDIRLGSATTFTDAMTAADDLHPFLPEAQDLEGYPCKVSGLWPVAEGRGKGPEKKIHPKVYLRKKELEKDYFTDRFLGPDSAVCNAISQGLNGYKPEFFTHISGEDDEGNKEDMERGRAGDNALGQRRRWAVIAMDGNDIGAQFRHAVSLKKNDINARSRIAFMSRELAEHCTAGAFEDALNSVVRDWMAEAELEKCIYQAGNEPRLVLPFRPLILGGDDILLLAHGSYALKFVRILSEAFTRKSQEAAERIKREEKFDLWPATNGKLTISAGIAYTGVTYPLHTSIPYAESLLASAKGGMQRLRTDMEEGQRHPTPAGVDWEHITETLIDTPAARRRRALTFHDEDLAMDIRLTRKPYPIDRIPGLVDTRCKAYQNIPGHIRASLKSILMKPWAQRCRDFAALERGGKETRMLAADLQQYEYPQNTGPGWKTESIHGEEYLCTDILDAVSLIDEEHRMAQGASKGGEK